MPSPRAKRCDRNLVIYVLTCIPTGEKYVGYTSPKEHAYLRAVKVRWQKHYSRAENEQTKTAEWLLCNAIRKHGKENFKYQVLEIVRGEKETRKRECELINSGEYALNTHKQKQVNN